MRLSDPTRRVELRREREFQIQEWHDISKPPLRDGPPSQKKLEAFVCVMSKISRIPGDRRGMRGE